MDLPIPYTLHGRTTIWVHTHPTQSTTGRRQPTHRPQHSASTRTTSSTRQHRPSPGPSSGKFRSLQQVDCFFFQSFQRPSWQPLAKVGGADQGAYTLRTGTDTGPISKGQNV